MPPARDAARGLLGDADLVKFARYAPATPAQAAVVATAQSILSSWDSATASPAAVATDRDPDGAGSHDQEGGA
jgi:hypothetical protein